MTVVVGDGGPTDGNPFSASMPTTALSTSFKMHD
jgi:hypothetical protein